MNLSEKEAFEAMFKFLDMYYQRTKSDDVGSLLGDMQFHEDGTTFDPATWEEWLECVKEVKKSK